MLNKFVKRIVRGTTATLITALYFFYTQQAFANPPNKPFEIRLWRNQNFCIDVDHAVIRNGTRIQLWGCNNSSAQIWVAKNKTQNCGISGCHMQYRIALRDYPNYCLDYYGSSERAPKIGDILYLWQCNQAVRWSDFSDPYQELPGVLITPLINFSSIFYPVVDLSGNLAEFGRTIQIWNSNDTLAQRWVIVAK